MMSWLYYLLESNLYLVVFYGFYRIFLHRETFYQLNRYYLIFSPVLAFLLPLFQIGYLNSLFSPVEQQSPILIQYSGTSLQEAVTHATFTTGDAFFYCYLLISAFLLCRLGTNLYGILRMALKADKKRENGFIQVNFSSLDTAFSFFNLLFINPKTEKQHIILQHEMIHIRQNHSLDILFFELLLICNWFNPFCWFMKRDIKLVHEYIADDATTNTGLSKHDYALFLIHNSFGPFQYPLASQIFNKSILKNRISMLNKKRTKGRSILRLLYVLPLIGGMLCASTLGFTKDYAIVDLYTKKHPSLSAQVPQESKQAQQKNYPIESTYDAETGGTRPIKLILINGKVNTAKNFISVYGYDKVVALNSTEAVAKYGKRAAKGALEFSGKNTKISIKFPPPIVTKVTFPPPAKHRVPPVREDTQKNQQVKFPPPIVRKVTFPPPAKQRVPPLRKDTQKNQQVKFPPPIVEPMKKYDETANTGANKQKLDVGPNPLYLINGKIIIVNTGEGKIVKFKAKSVKVFPKNNEAVIKKYGEAARDGVIDLEDGEFFYAEPDSLKKE